MAILVGPFLAPEDSQNFQVLCGIPLRSELDFATNENDSAPSHLGFRDGILLRKGPEPAANTWPNGTYYVQVNIDDDTSPIYEVTAEMVNSYWDRQYPSFTRILGPDCRYNCGNYAMGDRSSDDVPVQIGRLNSQGTQIGSCVTPEMMLTLKKGWYVYQYGYHFVKVEATGDAGDLVISQKNGESGVYSATMPRERAVEYFGRYRGRQKPSEGLYFWKAI